MEPQTFPVDPQETVKQLSNKYTYNESNTFLQNVVEVTRFIFFFNCNLTAPRPTLGHSQRDSLTNPMLITMCYLYRPEGNREPRSKVGSLIPAERIARFDPGTFRASKKFNKKTSIFKNLIGTTLG